MSRKIESNINFKILMVLVISLFITFFLCVNVKAYYRKNVNRNVSFTTKEYTDLTSSLNKTIYASGNNSTTVELTINNPNNYGVSYTLSFSNTNCTYLIDGASSTTYTVNGSGSKTHVINITGATGDNIIVNINSVRPYSASTTKTINFDASNPAPTISGGDSAKQTAQIFNLSCTDNIGVVGYYFGTTEPSSSTAFTAVTSTTSWTGTGSANSAATYWLGCKDAVGNIGKTSVIVRSINVSNMLLNINGTEANYNTSHYTRSNNPTYYVKNGTSFSAANMCSSPTGGNSLKGYNEAAPSTTTATIKSTDLVVDGNKTISCWYNRLTYTVTVSKPTNGSIKAETVTQTGNSVTASSSAQTLTVRYGDTVKGTATANTGWHFNGWSGGYLTANTTNPSTGGAITANKTITGAFTGNTYTLTYSNATATGATVPSATSCTVTSGSSCNVTLANSGYSYSGWTFNGWGTANNSTSGDAGGTSLTLTGNVTRYATWKKNAKTYTLTYSNATATGATVPSATSCTIAAVYNGASQATSCNVTLASSGYSYSGWTFNGWGTANNSTSGDAGGTSAALTGNATRYATWKKNAITYTVSFSNAAATGATVTSAQVSCTIAAVYNGATQGTSCNVALPTTGYSYSGWTFNGWGTGTTSTSGNTGTIAISSTHTRYATWKKNAITYTVSFSNAAATGATVTSAQVSCTISAVYNGATQGTSCNVALPTTGYSYSGWTFNGWGTGTTSTSGNTGTIAISSTHTRYATWKQTVTRTASYNANGGTGTTNSTSCTFTAYNGNTSGSCNVTLASNGFTKSGYYFSKWAIDSASGTQSDAGASVSIGSNKTFYAIWTSYTLTLRYNVNGGTITTGTGSERWRASSSLVQRSTNSGSSWTTITAVLNAATTDYDLWNVSTYGATKTGYTIVGDSAYNTKSDGTGVNINQQNTSSNTNNAVTIARINGGALTANKTIDMYIKWVETTATLTYNANGCGTAPSNVTMKYTAATSAASSMTMGSGWTLTGWNTKADGSGTAYAKGAQVKAANVVPSATTLYAQCSKSTTRTASYNANGGTGTTNSTTCTAYAYNGSSTYGNCNVTLASNGYSKTGYNFSKWAIDSASGTQYSAGGSVSIGSNKTFYAVWSEKTATLTYNANGCGTAPSNVTMKYTTATNAASSMTMGSGWTFTGWNTASGGNGTAYAAGAQVKAANVIPSAITLYAQCSKSTTRTLSYNGNGNTGGSTAASTCTAYAYNGSSSYGSCNVSLRSNGFTKTDYTFSKWAANSTSGTQYAPGASVTLTADVTYYAIWNIIPIRIYFHTNGGSVTASGYTTYNGWVSQNGSSYFFENITGTYDLYNYTSFGLTRSGYAAAAGSEWCTGYDGTGTCFNQDTQYTYANYKSVSYVNSDNVYEVDLYAHWTPTIPIRIYFHPNGGTVTASGYTTYNGWVSTNGSSYFFENIMGTYDLYNYTSFGITRSGYTVVSGYEWCTGQDGSGVCFNQDTKYTYEDYKATPAYMNSDGAYEIDLYVHWSQDPSAIKWRWRATCSCHASSVQSKYVYSEYNFNTSDEAYFNCNNAGAGLSACINWCSNIGGTGANASQCLGMSNQ